MRLVVLMALSVPIVEPIRANPHRLQARSCSEPPNGLPSRLHCSTQTSETQTQLAVFGVEVSDSSPPLASRTALGFFANLKSVPDEAQL